MLLRFIDLYLFCSLLNLSSAKCVPMASSIPITWEFVTNAHYWYYFHTQLKLLGGTQQCFFKLTS
jgi:hypothetical protein